MRVGLLGTGGAVSSERRGNTSLAFAAGTTLLVDCSGNPAQALAALGFAWASLEHVLLTHHHPDHLCGLPSLVHQLMVHHRADGRPHLTLWGPSSALETARKLLEAVGLWDREDRIELRLQPLPAAVEAFPLGDLRLTTFPVDHQDVPTLGVRVELADRPQVAAVYSADTGPSRAVWAQCRGASLLIHECSSYDLGELAGHATLAQLEELLPDRPDLAVRLVHLPALPRSEDQRAQQRLRQRFGDRVRLATDGELLEL